MRSVRQYPKAVQMRGMPVLLRELPELDNAQSALRFVGLTPGSVGLYQVNFLVPPVPSGTPPCSGSVRSNFTVSIGDARSFDGASICVNVAK